MALSNNCCFDNHNVQCINKIIENQVCFGFKKQFMIYILSHKIDQHVEATLMSFVKYFIG